MDFVFVWLVPELPAAMPSQSRLPARQVWLSKGRAFLFVFSKPVLQGGRYKPRISPAGVRDWEVPPPVGNGT